MKTPVGFANFCGRVSRVLCLFIVVLQPASAFDDPPIRVARLSYVAGQVSFQPGGDTDWGWATVNRPMTAGDSLWTGSSSRAEMHIGSTAIRMSAPTSVSFLNLDDRTVQIQLNSGTIDVRVPSAECGRMVTFPVVLFTAWWQPVSRKNRSAHQFEILPNRPHAIAVRCLGPDEFSSISRQKLTLASLLARGREDHRGGAMSAPQGHHETILVADDNEANRELLSALLSAEGYQVVCAADGQQALARVDSGSIDLALLDVVMPRPTGFEICQAMKSKPETRLIPVILLTSLNSDADRIHGIMCGADDFLNKPVNKHELLARVHSLLRLKQFTNELDNAETVLFSLALTIEAKDPYTEGHCDRLSKYSVALGEKLGLPQDLSVALRRGGLIHDIGKLAVPEHILLKPGPLTPEERKIMERHTVIGEGICAPLRSFRHVLPIIRHHHEKQDGSGYPDGLKGAQVPLTARILQITDIYDALTTDRPYRKALPSEKAFAIMREEVKRGWWDGSILDEFEAVVYGYEPVQPARSGS